MATCLVITPEELKPYTELGLNMHQITQDYLENGELRSPAAISYKIKARKQEVTSNYFDKAETQNEFLSEAEDFDHKVAENWAYQLSTSLGVEAQVVSRDQAKRIHADKGVAYGNENAFFTDGTVFFVEGTLTPESVVHEFSHPLIKSLDASVRNKLFNDLINDSELNGKAILDDVNARYNKDGQMSQERIQEEVLVRALTDLVRLEKNTPKVQNWLQKMMYQLKQLLRKLLGKTVNVKDLDGTTSLKDLAKIVASGNVMELQQELITSADVIEHFKAQQEWIDKFDQLNNSKDRKDKQAVQSMIDNVMETAIEQRQDILNNPEFFSLAEVFVDELNRQGLLNDVISTLGKDSTLSTTDIIQALNSTDQKGNLTLTGKQIYQRMSNLAHSFYKMKDMLTALDNQLEDIKDLDSKDKVDRLVYYKKFMQAWGEHIDTLYKWSLGESKDNPVKQLANELNSQLEDLNKKMTDMQVTAVEDVFVDLMQGPADQALQKFNEEVTLKKKGRAGIAAPQSVIDRMYKEFHNMTEAQYKRFKELEKQGGTTREYDDLYQLWLGGLEFNREKARAILKGEGRDSNYFNSMFESLSMNTDPTVSSVYKHIQNLTAKYEADALDWYADFIDTASDYVKKHELQVQNRGAIGRKLGFKDTKAVVKQDGTVEKVEEWTFLNPWKDYRYDQAELKQNLSRAAEKFKESNSEVDKKAYYDAKYAYQQWKNKYMHQEFTVDYYEAQDLLLKDDIGREANERREAIFEEINDLAEDNDGGKNDALIDNLRMELKKLSMTTDEFGNKKTGRELEIAERLKEYSEARSDFFIEDEIPGAFEDAYNDYSDFLLKEGYKKDSNTYKDKMDSWLRKNTRVVLKNSVFEKRAELIAEKEELLKQLNAKNKEIFDDTELQRIINEQSNLVKDTGNQPNGHEATADAREKVRKAHEELEEKRQDIITRSGLSVAENNRFRELRQTYRDAGKKWTNPEDAAEFQRLMDRKAKVAEELGLDSVVLARLSAIDEQLRGMISYVPTDYYKSTMIELLDTGELQQLFLDFSAKNGYVYDTIYDAVNEDFSDFAASDEMKLAMEKNSKLKKFVEQNHYMRGNKMTPTNLWTTSVSADPYNYRTKRLKDKSGKDLGLIKIDDQFRIPNSTFYTRIVKDKYVTKKTVGTTVDNRGNFLPKTESSNRYRNTAYYNLKQNDPEAFKFMEDIKAQYLKGQEGSKNQDRLYLAFPKTQKTALENVRTGNIFTWLRRLREWWFGREDDVLDYKKAKEAHRKDKRSLATYSLISTDVSKPVIGTYDDSGFGQRININDISTDILKTIPEYVASLKHKQGAVEANSYARMMQDVARNTEVDNAEYDRNAKTLLKKSHWFNLPNVFSKKQEQSTRSKIIDQLIERDINGVNMAGKGANWRRTQKLLDAMVKRSSKINFNWNIISGLVNYGQIKVTSYTHALSADEIDPRHALKGEAWATKASMKISRDIRSRGQKSMEEQMILVFDAIAGRNIDTIGDSLSRTYIGDVLDGKLAQNARHWLEMQGTLQNFAAMMYKKKVKITDKNGTREIPYIKAFEMEDGRIRTKEGIEAGYEITYDAEGNIQLGQKMIDHKLYMQNVIMKWNGAFAKKDAPLIGRWVLGKQMLFLKKHVIPLASKQYSFGMGTPTKAGLPSLRKRMNWATGTAEFGHSVTTLRVVRDMVTSLGTNLPSLTKSEIKSVLFTINQIVLGYILLPMLWRMLTPTYVDPDDPDEREKTDFKAMRARSGWYDGGFFGKNGLDMVTDEDYYEFNAKGYMLNTLSMISLKMMDEYNAVNWLGHPDGIEDLFTQSTSQSISMTQTLKYYKDLLNMMTGDAPKTPSRTTGPYFFEREGYENGNLYRLLFRFYGMNGKVLNPTGTEQKYEQAQRMK